MAIDSEARNGDCDLQDGGERADLGAPRPESAAAARIRDDAGRVSARSHAWSEVRRPSPVLALHGLSRGRRRPDLGRRGPCARHDNRIRPPQRLDLVRRRLAAARETWCPASTASHSSAEDVGAGSEQATFNRFAWRERGRPGLGVQALKRRVPPRGASTHELCVVWCDLSGD
ncbi:unnamed protein product [Urochloa humidicola]